jgi:hypothetical protein
LIRRLEILTQSLADHRGDRLVITTGSLRERLAELGITFIRQRAADEAILAQQNTSGQAE